MANAKGDSLEEVFFPGLQKETIVNHATGARTITAADFGKTILATYASGATTLTLPSPSQGLVGAWLDVGQTVNQDLIIVTDVADGNAIIADGVLTTDKVSFATSSHKVGARAHIVCISATKWMITNTSACTMTVEAAD